MDALDGETPGSVLIRLGLGTDADSTKYPISEWQADMDRSSKVWHGCVLLPSPSALPLTHAERCWHQQQVVPTTVRVLVYQARHLPAADKNGSIDPYVKVCHRAAWFCAGLCVTASHTHAHTRAALFHR